MGFAVSLRSDHPSAEAVRALWRDVEPFEDRPSMALLGYPPHVTLAVYDSGAIGEPELREALHRTSEDLDVLSLTFDAIRTFDGPPMVLWAAPRPSMVLQTLHAAVHTVIDPVHCRPHYRPEVWVPHCTLGTQVKEDQREAALAFASAFIDEIEVIFDVLDCVSFPPVAGVEMRRLR